MKKILAILICLLVLIPGQAFASSWSYANALYAGQTAYLTESYFEDDTGYYPNKTINRDNFNLLFDFGKDDTLVQKCYIDNSQQCVVLVIAADATANTSGTPLLGTITLWDRNDGAMYRMTFGSDNANHKYDYMVFPRSSSLVTGSGPYYLPSDYNENDTSFKGKSGTFDADFYEGAEFVVKISGQSALFLGCSTAQNASVTRKIDKNYPRAEYHFISWTASPTFANVGTLYIDAYTCDYLYEIAADGSLTLASDKVDKNNNFVIQTKTLGSYVMCTSKLSFAAASSASSSKVSSSSAAPSSSSAAPSSSSAAPSSSSAAPSSSSAAPSSSSSAAPSSSSAAPSSSGDAASETSESSLPPESSFESSSESSTPVVVPVEPVQKSFPWEYVIMGAMGVIIIALLIVLIAGRGRKSKKYDDWDE